jgi:hypothetical protein
MRIISEFRTVCYIRYVNELCDNIQSEPLATVTSNNSFIMYRIRESFGHGMRRTHDMWHRLSVSCVSYEVSRSASLFKMGLELFTPTRVVQPSNTNTATKNRVLFRRTVRVISWLEVQVWTVSRDWALPIHRSGRRGGSPLRLVPHEQFVGMTLNLWSLSSHWSAKQILRERKIKFYFKRWSWS